MLAKLITLYRDKGKRGSGFRGVLVIFSVFMLTGVAVSVGQSSFLPTMLSPVLFGIFSLMYWLITRVARLLKQRKYRKTQESPKVRAYIAKLRAEQESATHEDRG